MQKIRGIEAARLSGVVLSIGNFDGLHRGHRALIDRGVELARAAGTQLVAMTFEPHPAAILTPDRVPPTLTPLHEKLRLLEAAGVGTTVVVESRPEFFQLSAENFIRKVIIERFHPVAMVEGANFRFGLHRHGDIAMLQAAGAEHGFELHVVEPIRADLGGHPDTVISSSLVRHLLASGNVDRAALCLGRPYALFGSVQHGAGRGRSLGFPTANLAVEDQLIPAEGVYAGIAQRAAGFSPRGADPSPNAAQHTSPPARFPAAISIGRTPTFNGHEVLVEAYLLDFEGDLYDQPLRLDFLDWLRGQQRFDSVDALRNQIEQDVARVRDTVVI